jgi:hypothetical protein
MKLTENEIWMGEWEKVGKKGKILVKPSQEYLNSIEPTQQQIDTENNELLLKEMAEDQLGLIRMIEDIVKHLESKNDGFIIPEEQKERIERIKIKRGKLKELKCQ